MAQRELISSYNFTAKRFNEQWRKFLKQYEDLLRKDISRSAYEQATMSTLDSCFSDAENIANIAGRFSACPHAVSAEMAALSKKLKVLVEDRRYAAQERSVKAQRDHRLAELFDHASAVYNAGVENADGKRSETFYANHSTYMMTTVFVKFMEEAESLIKEAGEKPHETVDKIKPMKIEAVKLHEKACLKEALAWLEGDWPKSDKAEDCIKQLEKLNAKAASIATIKQAIAQAEKRMEEKRLREEKESEEKAAKKAEAEAKFKAEMREKWILAYTGGTMKVGGLDWSYGADGTIMGPNNVKIFFDGSRFACDNISGSGWWNGEGFGWRSHYTDYCEYVVRDGRIVVGFSAPIDWDWNANQNMLTPKGHAAATFSAAQRTGSIPYPAMLMIVMYDWIHHKSDQLNGHCMCNQRLFDKGEPGFLCNNCHINRGHLCPICDSQFVVKRNAASVCSSHSYYKLCVVCKQGYGGWSHPAFVCDHCGQSFKDNCVQRK